MMSLRKVMFRQQSLLMDQKAEPEINISGLTYTRLPA